VEWAVPFGGDARWEYEIVFAENFSAVTGGTIRKWNMEQEEQSPNTFRAPWEPRRPGMVYVHWSPPPETIFGSVFVQGFSYAPVLEGIASYHFDSPEGCYISYGNAPPGWELDDGSRPPARKPFTAVTFDAAARRFTGTVDWAPVGFGGDAMWQYEILFAEDFARVVGGTLRAFASAGDAEPASETAFGDTDGDMAEGELFYVRRPDVVILA
jgi:hypothetical protein